MIAEIVNFIEYLEEYNPEIIAEAVVPPNGIYFFVDNNNIAKSLRLDENVDKSSEQYQKILNIYKLSVNHFGANKSFNSSKKIFTEIVSPFAIAIRYDTFKKKEKEIEYGKSKDPRYFENALEEYFKNSEKYVENSYLEDFRQFKVLSISSFKSIIKEKVQDLNKEFVFLIYDKFPFELQQSIINKFSSEKIFNKEKFNKILDNHTYGVSDNLATFNDKKPFLMHQTAFFEKKVSYRVDYDMAYKVMLFYKLIDGDFLPNPFPLFIDRKELSSYAITLYHESGRKKGIKEIIIELSNIASKGQNEKKDLQNYYLIYFSRRDKGSKILDIDFVPVFRFKLSNIDKKELFVNSDFGKAKFFNVFDIEEKIFDRVLERVFLHIDNSGNRKTFNYFNISGTTISKRREVTGVLYYKYRKAIYDFVYKSQWNRINRKMFEDIMINTILDDIRSDEIKDGHHTKTFDIHYKLNVWFNFAHFFDTNKQLNTETMANKTLELQKKVASIAQGAEYIETDEEFAFAAGQLIREILNQSKAEERSHSLLEPFLQKSDPKAFKLQIAKAFDTYKHEFTFYHTHKRYAFDNIMSQVLGFEPEVKNIRELLAWILAGYFSKSVFYKE